MRRFVASILTLARRGGGRYMPHQGHKECERRMQQGIAQQWKHALKGKGPRFSVGVDPAAPGEDRTFRWGRGACLPEDKGAVWKWGRGL